MNVEVVCVPGVGDDEDSSVKALPLSFSESYLVGIVLELEESAVVECYDDVINV